MTKINRSGGADAECDCHNRTPRPSSGDVHSPGGGGNAGSTKMFSTHVPAGKLSLMPSANIFWDDPSTVTLICSRSGANPPKSMTVGATPGEPMTARAPIPIARLCNAELESRLLEPGPVESLPQAESEIRRAAHDAARRAGDLGNAIIKHLSCKSV